MEIYEAATTLSMAHVMAATARLRRDLRQQVLAEETVVLADWDTLRVAAPVEKFDDNGCVVYEYRATVECLTLAECTRSTAAV
jgi:hypothetical protein